MRKVDLAAVLHGRLECSRLDRDRAAVDSFEQPPTRQRIDIAADGFGRDIELLADAGLAETLGEGLVGALGVSSLFAITLIAVVIAVLISETTSNTASAAVVVPIVVPIAVAAGVNPVIPALAATFGASYSYGFMLPVSTPPNAIVYGSGLIPITKMVRARASYST